ncbi:SMI1/KNR4 family protein, partial [Proteus mirabilis]|nr:SMI1/KNR4 family protein [Proteus mirabilis]
FTPLAKKGDSVDVACFYGHSTAGDSKVYYVHVFAPPGGEDHGTAFNFYAWTAAVEHESVVYKSCQSSQIH